MAIPAADTPHPLAELISYLFTRREAILNQWRATCEQDPAAGRVSALNREEFNNLLPLVLDILDQRLLDKPEQVDAALTAEAHGLHRWHKAYSLINTIQELNHLTQTLNNELGQFQRLFPGFDLALLLNAQQQIGQLMQETINGSVRKYDELQRLQATNRANALQQAVTQMETLSTQRGDMLRTSAHDLRGSFGIINSAAYLLKDQALSQPEREQFIDMLSRNLGNVQTMLTSLMDLSRLEAGQEQLQFESVDAAQLLQELVASAQPLADERGVHLQANGPTSLLVTTDRVKLQRIAQNLLINALKYTTSTAGRSALVSVSWSMESETRWGFSVQDSGAGLPAGLVSVFAQQLQPTVEPTSVLGVDQAEPVAVTPDDVPQIPGPAELDSVAKPAQGGEGVGLQIVKRLCELLDANLDVETKEGRGTLFRIRLPVHANV